MDMLKTHPEERFSYDWFKARAFQSIKKLGEGVYDFSDSLLLYIPKADDAYEDVQQEGNPYHEMVTAPEVIYLKQIARDIVNQLPDHFEYIDLGPGTAKKAQYIFDEMKAQGKKCIYHPVDISENYLERARAHAEQEGFPSESIRSPFEAVPGLLGDSSLPRYVSLGLTYPNYMPKQILALLAEIAGENGHVFVNVQIRERIDMTRIREVYNLAVFEMVKLKMELLDLDVSTDVEGLEANEDLEVWCVLKKVTPALKSMGLNVGDRLLLFQSLRPNVEDLKHDLDDSPFEGYELLDKGSSFVGALLRTKSKLSEEDLRLRLPEELIDVLS